MLPKKLKDFNVFSEGESWMGRATEIVLPTLEKKLEDLNTGNGFIGLDMGNEAMECEVTLEEMNREVLNQYGLFDVAGAQLVFRGALVKQDSSAQVDSVEVVMRGRWKQIDPGTATKGENHQMKTMLRVAYFKYRENNEDVIEIDFVNNKEIINGVDRLEAQNAAVGN